MRIGLLLYWMLSMITPASALALEQFTNSLGMRFVKIEPPTGVSRAIAAKKACNDSLFLDDDCGNPQMPGPPGQPYWIGVTELTQAQWRKVMGDSPSYYKGDDRPVEQVSFKDIQRFLKKLNQMDRSHHYRLPTEWEWEYAARGGTATAYWWGDEAPVCRKGARNGAKFDDDDQCNDTGTEPVMSYKPNPFGLYDVAGNVWEWTCTLYSKPYGERCDPPESLGSRVVRGGSWSNGASYLRAAVRDYFRPGYQDNNLGIRLAVSAAPRN